MGIRIFPQKTGWNMKLTLNGLNGWDMKLTKRESNRNIEGESNTENRDETEKVKAIQVLKHPDNHKQLKPLLGAKQYLAKFSPRL